MPAETVGLVKLGLDEFAKLVHFFTKHWQSRKLDQQIQAAWRELVNDTGDKSKIESALAAAKAVGNTSPGLIKLEAGYARPQTSKRKASKGGARKTGAATHSRRKKAAPKTTRRTRKTRK